METSVPLSDGYIRSLSLNLILINLLDIPKGTTCLVTIANQFVKKLTCPSIPTILSDKVSLVVSLSSGYWNLFLYFPILLFYLLIISHYKVKSTFGVCNQKKIFYVQKCIFLLILSNNQGFVDIFLLEFLFQSLFCLFW